MFSPVLFPPLSSSSSQRQTSLGLKKMSFWIKSQFSHYAFVFPYDSLTPGKGILNALSSCLPHRMESRNLACIPTLFCLGGNQRHVHNGARCRLLLPHGKRLPSPEQSRSCAQSHPVPGANHHEAPLGTSNPHRNSPGEKEHCPRCKGTKMSLMMNWSFAEFATCKAFGHRRCPEQSMTSSVWVQIRFPPFPKVTPQWP